MDKAFIAETINVGYQERKDTYTGKLAYIIYYDKKGKLRKEKSWQSWRNQDIKNTELPNEPTEGFVLNKGVGGVRQSYGHNARNEYIRIYDPRGFEFEISVGNLLFILQNCDCNKGKGLEGQFVYAWWGTELVLLPINTEEYKNSVEYSRYQDKKVSLKDIVPGITYITKQGEELTYLGRFNYYFVPDEEAYYKKDKNPKGVRREHMWWNGKGVETMSSGARLAEAKSEDQHPEFAALVDKFIKSKHGSKVARFTVKQDKTKITKNRWGGIDISDHHRKHHHVDGDAYIQSIYPEESEYRGSTYSIRQLTDASREAHTFMRDQYRHSIKDGVLVAKKHRFVGFKKEEHKTRFYNTASSYRTHYRYGHYNENVQPFTTVDYREPSNSRLYVELESGSQFRVIDNRILETV